jgi:hypothetical protein
MEPEGSLPHSQEPATCPYPEPYPSSILYGISTLIESKLQINIWILFLLQWVENCNVIIFCLKINI